MSQVLELWQNFKFAELTEVLRQQGDDVFIDLLAVRKNELTEYEEIFLNQNLFQSLILIIHTTHYTYMQKISQLLIIMQRCLENLRHRLLLLILLMIYRETILQNLLKRHRIETDRYGWIGIYIRARNWC